jgi:hypothetical protein
MAADFSVNTFIKGMQHDINKSIQSPDTYLNAENFRLVTDDNGNTGVLQNIKGTTLKITLTNTDEYVVGHVFIRDALILFIHKNIGANPDSIHRVNLSRIRSGSVTLNNTNYYHTNTAVNTLIYKGELSWTANTKIKAVSRYETDFIQKIYWVDGSNPLRTLNIVYNAEFNDLTTLAIDKLGILPNITFSNTSNDWFRFNGFVTGNLKASKIQYAYQLYTLYGAETIFSPLTNLIPISASNDDSSNDRFFYGSEIDEITGKGISGSFYISSTGFTNIRIVAVQYEEFNQIPTVRIIEEKSTTVGYNSFIDTGQTLGEYTPEEFIILRNSSFVASELETKNDILFPANIKEEFFDIGNYDTRAYRFNNTASCSIYQEDGVTLEKTFTSASYPNMTTEKEFDCVNPYNILTNDGNATYRYIYKADGSTIGAQGPNIEINFVTSNLDIQDFTSNIGIYGTSVRDANDISYDSYASGYNVFKFTSHQRDEIYRYAIRFRDNKGRKSNPSWICDLRFPNIKDNPHVTNPSDSLVVAHPIGIAVKLNNYPTNAVSYEIVRVKRDSLNRTIFGQGLLSTTKLDPAGYYCRDYNNSGRFIDTTTDNTRLVAFSSPEVSFNKNLSNKGNDFIKTEFALFSTDTDTLNGTLSSAVELYSIDTTTYPNLMNKTSNIEDSKILTQQDSISGLEYNIGGNRYKHYCNEIGVATRSNASTSNIIYLSSDISAGAAFGAVWLVANYKRGDGKSIYGGIGYNNRQFNEYITCGQIFHGNNFNNIYGGDTYINIFDLPYIMFDLSKGSGVNDSVLQILTIPFETSINLNYRHDKHFNKIVSSDTNIVFLQELAGVHHALTQETDLYLYNSVYSQDAILDTSIPLPIDYLSSKSYDTRVLNSNTKINGEISDSWLKYNVNDFIDVDTKYGKLTNLINSNDNKLLYWQDHAFGVLSVNERSIIQDNNVSGLVLGTGGVLDRYDYISINSGTEQYYDIIQTPLGIYWYYPSEKGIYRYSQNSLNKISRTKFIQSKLNTIGTINNFCMGYDAKYNEVLASFDLSSGTDFTIIFNELEDNFSANYTFIPSKYIYNKEFLFSKLGAIGSNIYQHNIGNYGVFYDQSPAKSTLRILVNKDYLFTKVFDNLDFITESTNSSNINQFADTFDRIRIYNDYQNTDWVNLVYNTNIKRKNRTWTMSIPRNIVDDLVTNNPNIFTTIDSTNTYKERIKDKYIVVELEYNNTDNNKFSVQEISTKYRYFKR